MSRVFISILILHSTWASLSLIAQAERLSYKLQAGELYLMEIDIQQTTRSESLNSEDINLYSLIKLELTVDSTDENRLIYLSACYRDLLVSMLAPQMNMDINSSNGKNRVLTQMVKSLEKDTFQLLMTESGELKQVLGLDSMFADLAFYSGADSLEHQVSLNTLEEVYGPNSFASLFKLFSWVYPVIHPMNNWTTDITYYFNTKPVKMVNRYNLTKSTEEVLTIQGLGILNSQKEFLEITGMGKVKSTVSGDQTFDFQMDIKSGWIKRCVSRQRLMIETTIVDSPYLPGGLKIPSYTETVFEVKGSRIR